MTLMIGLSRQIIRELRKCSQHTPQSENNKVSLCNAYMLNGIFNVRGNSKVEELAFRQSNTGKQ